MPCHNVILHIHEHILSCQFGAQSCLKHLVSFLFAELLFCKAIMFLSIRSVGVLKRPYVLPFCKVTVFKNLVILHVRIVEISKLLLSCLRLSIVLSLC